MSFPPFLKPATIKKLQGAVRRGFSTVQALDDPPVSLAFSREADDGTITTLPAVAVVMRFSAIQTAQAEDESASYAQTTGTLRRFAPWDVRVGDRFSLPDGHRGVVETVAPVRFGIQSAVFVVEEGVL